MKTPNSTQPTQCPFCKTLNYAVEYCGVKTKEEKGIEQIEEQRVIEAKIRMRQQELQDEELRMLTRQEISSSSRSMLPGEVGYSTGEVDEEIVSSQIPLKQSLRPRQNRHRHTLVYNIASPDPLLFYPEERRNEEENDGGGEARQSGGEAMAAATTRQL